MVKSKLTVPDLYYFVCIIIAYAAELKEKANDNNSIIKAKLQEKYERIKAIQTQLQSLITAVGNMNNQSGKQEIAKQLIENGLYDAYHEQ
jgi:hypothetical protein